jgi:hypothetical protein
MSNPFDKATSKAPPTIGEGCLGRYDIDTLSPEDGTDFEGAAQLWKELTSETVLSDKQSDGLDPQ